MEPGVLQNVLLFLVDTLLSLYALVFTLRFLLTLAQADFYNPLSQAIAKLTQAPLSSAHLFIPSFGHTDLACILIAYGLKVLALFLTELIQGNVPLAAPLLTVGLIHLTETVIYVYILSLVIFAISSWFMSITDMFRHPLMSLLYSLVLPPLRQTRRFVRPVGMVDISPLVLLVTLYLLLTILRTIHP